MVGVGPTLDLVLTFDPAPTLDYDYPCLCHAACRPNENEVARQAVSLIGSVNC